MFPRRGNTLDEKQHVKTFPVKLLRLENNLRKKNPDRMFAKSVIDDMFTIAKAFGSEAVTLLSNNNIKLEFNWV